MFMRALESGVSSVSNILNRPAPAPSSKRGTLKLAGIGLGKVAAIKKLSATIDEQEVQAFAEAVKKAHPDIGQHITPEGLEKHDRIMLHYPTFIAKSAQKQAQLIRALKDEKEQQQTLEATLNDYTARDPVIDQVKTMNIHLFRKRLLEGRPSPKKLIAQRQSLSPSSSDSEPSEAYKSIFGASPQHTSPGRKRRRTNRSRSSSSPSNSSFDDSN